MSDSSAEIARLSFISRVLFASGGLPILIFGTIGNFINLFAFICFSQFNKLPISIFLIASFIFSQFTLTFSLIPQLIYRISGYDPLSGSIFLCKLRYYFGLSSGTIALNSIGLAGLSQYLLTSRIVRLRHLITRKLTLLVAFSMILFFGLLFSPVLFFYTHTTNSANVTICTTTNADFTAYNGLIVYSSIPVIVLVVSSVLTWHNARSRLVQGGNLQQNLARMLIIQFIVVLLTTVPNLFNQIYALSTRTVPKNAIRQAQENLLSSILGVLSFSTFGASFYIYIFASKAFRNNIRSLFHIHNRRVQPENEMARLDQG
ncbi:unnamed protein product [Adineta ricciae]|uniref:G-protein coupled receptors family 1 profile domain-containing protein n=1 Tax=Adineta ricciae TaxID=249248 RepID=A0A815NHX5_ADIRI|nr:unnamed protein product [Adineta ricciae]CAF1438045.1 unnamed protein product [Adineta ricciae]